MTLPVEAKTRIPDFGLANLYSTYEFPSGAAEYIARDGIVDDGESGSDMIARVARSLFAQEQKYGYDHTSTFNAAQRLIKLCDSGHIVMGTPILTSAGRYLEKPLAACSVLPVNFETNPEEALRYMNAYHNHNIGLGIDLTEYQDPLKVIFQVNQAVLESAGEGKHDRHIGNMGTISVRHPKILEVIKLKTNLEYEGYPWRFNFSVVCDDEFMQAAMNNQSIQLTDGASINAANLMLEISEAAAQTGDPGLIFIGRLNENNPTPGVGVYKSVAPCAEVGLIEGEACQFGYLNLGKFIRDGQIDMETLADAISILTRALDNALDISIENLAHPLGQEVMRAKRKIGIGICGLADMFIRLGLPYDSDTARTLAQDLIAFINFNSKKASVELAIKRGPALAMRDYSDGDSNKHYAIQTHLSRYAHNSRWVTAGEWQGLADQIKETGLLRNVATIALPPTGRSSFLVAASPGIEPWFTVLDGDGEINPLLMQGLNDQGLMDELTVAEIKRRQRIGRIGGLPDDLKRLYITATEISPEAHLDMVARLQRYNDESVSKTVNLPQGTTAEQVRDILIQAYTQNLCAVTVYINKSRKDQPKSLGENG